MPGDSPGDGCFSATAQLWHSRQPALLTAGQRVLGRKIQPPQPVLSQRVVFSLLGPAWDLIAREPRSWGGLSPGSWAQQPLQAAGWRQGWHRGWGIPTGSASLDTLLHSFFNG